MSGETGPTEVQRKPPSLMELSNVLSPLTRIREIRLLESSIKSMAETPPPSVSFDYTFGATTTVDRDNKALTVKADLALSAENVLNIQAVFLLTYSLDETALDIASIDKIAEAFGKINGVFNIWPYWREYVQSSVIRAGLPPLTIPLLTGASVLAYYAAKLQPSTSKAAQQPEESGPRPGGTAEL